MKYILKTPLLIGCFSITFIIGCFLGYGISTDFSNLYTSKLMLIAIRYPLLALIVIVNFLVFSQLNGTAIILRKKTLFNFLISIIKTEVIILFFLFTILHLPILFLNVGQFLNYLDLIIEIIINCIIISMVLVSLINIMDLKSKNRAVACGTVLVSFCMMDFLLEHINWFIIKDQIFDFSYIFVLPFMYSNYIFIALMLIITVLLLTSLYVFFKIKKDYFLGSVYDEKN